MHSVNHPPAVPVLPQPRRFVTRNRLIAIALLVVMGVLAFFLFGRTEVAQLSTAEQMSKAGVQAGWTKGDIIVLVRHAERCDRSKGACLGESDGITVAGSQASVLVGKGISSLGLERTDVFASPLTRTKQTAHYMFNQAPVTQDWVEQCKKSFTENVLSHKQPDRNLVLVTHSGCIDQVERQLGVAGGKRDSEYAQAFFLSVGTDGKAKILGKTRASEWQKIMEKTGQ